MKTEDREAVALFRFGLISEFVHSDVPRAERKTQMKKVAKRKHKFPVGVRETAITVSKLKSWLSAYNKGGIEALKPKIRSDKGICKAIEPPLIRKILEVKKATPSLSILELIRSLEDAEEAPVDLLKKSTVHRLLQNHNLSGRPGLDPGLKPQRLPFTYPMPLDLWIADVMHGRVLVLEQKVYLIAFLDCATRAVMHAAFAFDEGALSVLEVFRQALLTRGLCRRLYVDHGSAFVDSRMARTCAYLGIHHMLAPVGDGAAKGAIERFFGRVRRQFECYLQADDLTDLSTLNSLLWRWIHSTYHRTPHSGLNGDTPWSRFLRRLPETPHRRVPSDYDFVALWRTRAQRTIRNDGTVRLKGHVLEVPPTVTRRRIELRYLEEKLPEDVEVWSQGKLVGGAQPVDLEKNASRRRWRPTISKKKEELPLDPLSRARNTWQRDR
jgi:transposase InsO family protein